MKVLLLEIGGPREEYNEPLGIELINAYLRSRFRDHNIEIEVDLMWFFETSRLPQKNDIIKYDVIGVSLQIGSISRFTEFYSEYCKLVNPPILILGNVIPTFASENVLVNYNKAICLQGEGEVSFYKICKELAITGNVTLSNIPGVTFIDQKNNTIISYPATPINVQKLPHSERHFLEYIRKTGGIARIEGSRGCSWGKCKFCCVETKYGESRWRPFPIEYIISELEILGKNKIFSPYFTDEDFFGNNYERGKLIAKRIIENKNNGRIPNEMNFFLSVMANDVINNDGLDALKLLKQAGLREVFIGIESLSKQQLNRFGKKSNVSINKDALEKLYNLGVQIDIGYILFDPYMDYLELEKNMQYLEQLTLNSFDSRSLKKIRIQPKTALEKSYSDVVTDSIDYDNLVYPYSFKDSKVQAVVDLYEKWEAPLKKQTYALQAKSRGEIASEETRSYFKNQLGLVRDIEFKALKKIVLSLSKTMNFGSIPDDLRTLHIEKENLLSQSLLKI